MDASDGQTLLQELESAHPQDVAVLVGHDRREPARAIVEVRDATLPARRVDRAKRIADRHGALVEREATRQAGEDPRALGSLHRLEGNGSLEEGARAEQRDRNQKKREKRRDARGAGEAGRHGARDRS